MRIPCGYPHPIRADLDVDTKVVSADEDMSQSTQDMFKALLVNV